MCSYACAAIQGMELVVVWRRLRNWLIASLTYHFHRQWKLLEAGGGGGALSQVLYRLHPVHGEYFLVVAMKKRIVIKLMHENLRNEL